MPQTLPNGIDRQLAELLLKPETRESYRQRMERGEAGGALERPHFGWDGADSRGSRNAVLDSLGLANDDFLPSRSASQPVGGSSSSIRITPDPAVAGLPSHPTYEILREIGRGTSSTVYEAYDRTLRRYVAIKQLDERFQSDGRQAELFWTEARFLAGLVHANIVAVHAIDEARGWIIMELMNGSLEEKLKEGPLRPELVRSILRQALEGLKYLHQQNKLHGEVRPGSLLIDDRGRVKLSDSPGFSVGGEFRVPVGSQRHVAPELLSPEAFGAVGPGVDLYCLGFTALELLKGAEFERLFKGVGEQGIDRDLAWMRWHSSPTETLPPVKELVPGLPDDLAIVIDRLLKKDVANRFRSAEEALKGLAERPFVAVEVAGQHGGGAQLEPQGPGAIPLGAPPAFYQHQAAAEPAGDQWTSLLARLGDAEFRRQVLRDKRFQFSMIGLFAMLLLVVMSARPGGSRAASPLVRVASDPQGATVIVDGIEQPDKTPSEISLAPGEHKLELRRSGYETLSETITVKREPSVQTLSRFQLLPDRGTFRPIDVRSEPAGAVVFVDGRQQSPRTPATINVQTGLRKIRLTRDGYLPLEKSIDVTPQTRDLRFTLQLQPVAPPAAQPPVVRILSEPSGAALRVDGNEAAENTPASISLKPGRHNLRLSLAGYEPLQAAIEVTPDRREFTFPLEKLAPAPQASQFNLKLTTNPPGARVTIDDRPAAGVTPETFQLANGEHQLRLELDGYETYRTTVRIAGFDDSRQINLIPAASRGVAGWIPQRPIPGHLSRQAQEEFVQLVENLLGEAWDARPSRGPDRAQGYYESAKRITADDPRLYHAYGLVLVQHGKLSDAVDSFERAVSVENAQRPAGLPFLAPRRESIRLHALLENYNRAAAQTLELAGEIARVAREFPPGNRSEDAGWLVEENVGFLGKMVGYLKGPASSGTRRKVDFDQLQTLITANLSSQDRVVFDTAVGELTKEFQSRLALAKGKDESRDQREQKLRDSGERGRQDINAERLAIGNKLNEKIRGEQTLAPEFERDESGGGTRLKSLKVGKLGSTIQDDSDSSSNSFGSAPRPTFKNSSRSYISHGHQNTVNNTRTQKIYETPARPQDRDPYVLSSYLPADLYLKRLMVLQSFPQLAQRD